jgi:putative hemolysin
MQWLSTLAHPLVALFSVSSNGLLKLLGGHGHAEQPVSAEEIKAMLQEGTAAGVFERAEQTMVGNVFRLDELRVSAIMTPRMQIAYLDLDDSDDANRAVLVSGRFRTLPVCRGGLDNILGLLDTKAFLARSLSGEPPDIAKVTHTAVFIPETVSPIQMLETLRRQRAHTALVLDEYGSVEGIVTLSDLLQAIISDPTEVGVDESDDAVQRQDGSWLLDGRLSLERVSTLLQLGHSLGSAECGYHTLGGLSMDRLGRVPRTGDRFNWRGLAFEVVDMDGNRVDRLLVQAITAQPADGPDA